MFRAISGLHFHKSTHRVDETLVLMASSVDNLKRLFSKRLFGSLLIRSLSSITYSTLLLLSGDDDGDEPAFMVVGSQRMRESQGRVKRIEFTLRWRNTFI